MNRGSTFLKGIVAGGALAYFFDRDRGARRRRLVRDRIIHLVKKLEHGLGAAGRDARNRSVGIAAGARGHLRRDHASDVVIEDRIRSRLGRIVSSPGAITVHVRDGRATLTGSVLADELEQLLTDTRHVRGVQVVESRLDVHESAEGVPALQGHVRPRRPRPELLQDNWTPALRLLGGLAGAAALVRGRRRSGARGAAASALGGALLMRATTNRPLFGVRAGARAITIQKTINIPAPVGEVWELWSHFENFPRFMAHLEEVRITGDGRSHWVACGPAGTCFEWEAEITRWEPEKALAWRSLEGAAVATAGQVHFQPTEDGGTRVDVHLSYTPPAGAVGHMVASLLGSDPKHAMDDDMVRLKSLFTHGKASVFGDTVTREELRAPGAAAP